ncbi:DUF6644 family protein [Sphingomonas sp. GlSt437]|uniref:DUF6644 family protein n=1 Tax=Sphingomonas sp. GlSt437 TaxID=3389970 RepID=UPI003A859109
MIEAIFRWLGATPIGGFMRESTWGFAIVETIHLLALAALGGAVLAINLGAARVLFRRGDAAAVATGAAPVLRIALGVTIVSGVLLVSSKPVRYYLDPTFRAKMVLLLLAALSSLIVQRLTDEPASNAARAVALLSLALWLGVGVCGRMIGFL